MKDCAVCDKVKHANSARSVSGSQPDFGIGAPRRCALVMCQSSWRAQLGNEQRAANRRESLEKTIAKILHRYCNFGWANYYIPGEKFPSLIEELVEIASPAGQAGYEEIVHF